MGGCVISTFDAVRLAVHGAAGKAAAEALLDALRARSPQVGLDEAGRGALFGPVFAAAVILNPERRIKGLDDSKTLAPARREELSALIRERALAWAVAAVDASRIDAWNILQASKQARKAARGELRVAPDYLLLDAVKLDFPLEQKSLIHGDALSVSIAAASLLAKVERDRAMDEFDLQFPKYGLAQNKGYGTPEHLEALRRYALASSPSSWMTAAAATSSFSSRRSRRTPCVERPASRISLAWTRMTLPCAVIIITSLSSVTCNAATTAPLRSVVFKFTTPLPPREVTRYSRSAVRLP
jgi:ribonuclease HII